MNFLNYYCPPVILKLRMQWLNDNIQILDIQPIIGIKIYINTVGQKVK